MDENRFSQIHDKLISFGTSAYAEKIVVLLSSFFLGLISSRGLAFGKYAPFSVAFTASVPKGNTWAAALGGVIGYMLPTAVYMPFRYIAAIIAVSTIKWALSEVPKLSSHALFAPILSFIVLMATGMTMVLINSSLPSVAVMYVA